MKPQIRATVDSAALRHNLARVRALAPGSRVMAVVKANAYGHGLIAASKALAETDGLAVARIDEGLALRSAGLRNRVLLLEGVFSDAQLSLAAREHFDLMVHSFEQIRLLEEWSGSGRFRVWIKIDSGMNRLGFRLEYFPEAYQRLRRLGCLAADPVLVTHLANADEPDDPMTARQMKAFGAVTAGLPGERSIANSAGILAWPDSRADWVRPGLMLYGASPFAAGHGEEHGLRAAMTLQTEVIAVKEVRAGETVGYGAEWRAPRDLRMAVAAAGYGDGYMRSMESGTPVQVAGHRARLIGRVSMDMITLDLSGLPDVRPGDPVVLWGPEVPVEDVARHSATIPWELLCAVSPRVHHEMR